jgi:hypothetical protein
MQQLTNGLNRVMEAMKPPEGNDAEHLSEDSALLCETAERWGKFCLHTFRGELLQKALSVSVALIDFAHEMG